MARHLIVAQFQDYGAGHRALCELIQAGVPPNRVSIVAGERSDSRGGYRDFGILEDAERYLAAVRRGMTLLAVAAEGAEDVRVTRIVERHAPINVTTEDGDLVADAGRDRPSREDDW